MSGDRDSEPASVNARKQPAATTDREQPTGLIRKQRIGIDDVF